MNRVAGHNIAGRDQRFKHQLGTNFLSACGGDGQINFPRRERSHKIIIMAIRLVKMNSWFLHLEASNNAGDNGVHKKWHTAHPHATRNATAKTCHSFGGFARCSENGFTVHGQLPAQSRGLQGPSTRHKQRLAHPLFHHGKCARNGGLRLANQCSTFGHTTSLNHGGQMHQMSFIKLHNKLLYSVCKSLSTAGFIQVSLHFNNAPNGSKRNIWEN